MRKQWAAKDHSPTAYQLPGFHMTNQDYSVKQLLEMGACTNCQACTDVYPAVNASSDGELSAVYRMKGLGQLLRGRKGFLARLFRMKPPSEEQIEHFSDTAFRCTLCGNCQEVCPVGIHLKDLWLSLRQDMVHSGHYPKKINMIRENLEEEHNVFGEDNEERAEWVEDMPDPPEDGYLKDQAEIVYFTGCTSAYFPLAQKIPMAFAEILDKSQVNFTLLGEEEWCCGFPMLGAGLKEMFLAFQDHNVKAVQEKGGKEVLFSCPSCYQMWLEHYPKGFKLTHTTRFLLRLIRENRIPLQELPLVVTYHDPCDLGRGARVFDEPREIIRSIPGLRFVELPSNRENCQCCGAEATWEWWTPSSLPTLQKERSKRSWVPAPRRWSPRASNASAP